MSPVIRATHFTDPGCPWAYSAWPALATLMWRFGDQLEWRHVMIGLAEEHTVYERRGYTPAANAAVKLRFGGYGMPFSTQPAPRVAATGLACRAIVAVRRLAPELELHALRALQFVKFTTPHLIDTDEGVRAALANVPGLDADVVLAELRDEVTERLYQRDRADARTAAGSPTEAQGKTADTDGAVRYTAPSVVFERVADGAVLEAGGFQPIEAYDVLLANLDPTLARRAPADDVCAVLAAFPYPLTTAEVAAIRTPALTAPDPAGAELALIEATADGRVRRQGVGDGAVWSLRDAAAVRPLVRAA